MKRVTGIGGAFFKSKDPQKLAEWYEKHLGIPFNGGVYSGFTSEDKGEMTVFSMFPEDTDYFAPAEKPFMFNFRVEDLHKLLETLKEEGVEVLEKTEEYSYGKFGWIVDPEGNKIELWEPSENGFES